MSQQIYATHKFSNFFFFYNSICIVFTYFLILGAFRSNMVKLFFIFYDFIPIFGIALVVCFLMTVLIVSSYERRLKYVVNIISIFLKR